MKHLNAQSVQVYLLGNTFSLLLLCCVAHYLDSCHLFHKHEKISIRTRPTALNSPSVKWEQFKSLHYMKTLPMFLLHNDKEDKDTQLLLEDVSAWLMEHTQLKQFCTSDLNKCTIRAPSLPVANTYC